MMQYMYVYIYIYTYIFSNILESNELGIIHQEVVIKHEFLSLMNQALKDAPMHHWQISKIWLSTCRVVSQICCHWRRFEKEILVLFQIIQNKLHTETVHNRVPQPFLFTCPLSFGNQKRHRDVSNRCSNTSCDVKKKPSSCASRMCTLSSASFVKWRRRKWRWIRRGLGWADG